MKRILAILLTAAVLCTMIPTSVLTALAEDLAASRSATSGQTGDCTWSIENDTLTISGNGAMGNYTFDVPPPWMDYYEAYSTVTTVIIEEGVTTIGDYAFSDGWCGYLYTDTFMLPDSLTAIGDYAFAGCSLRYSQERDPDNDNLYHGSLPLEAFTIPKNVTTIGEGAFKNCDFLNCLVIKGTLTEVGTDAFYGCRLEEVYFHDDIKSITVPNMFDGCSNLKYIYLSQGLNYIGEKCFFNELPSLEYVGIYSVPSSGKDTENILTIGDYAFLGCTHVSNFQLPWKPVSIGDHAFTMSPIQSINDHHELIYTGAGVEAPGGIVSIGESAFAGCDLQELSLSNELLSIGDYAFCGCTLQTVSLSEGLLTIGDYAFAYCSELLSVSLPDSVMSIGENAFLDTRYYSDMENWIGAEDGMPADSSSPAGALYIGNHLIKYNGTDANYTVREGTITIADGAFKDNTYLQSVTLPDSVKHIGNNAFSGCTALTSVTLSANLQTIGDGAFQNCKKLTFPAIPATVQYIGKDAFKNCVLFESITFPPDYKGEVNGFAGCTSLTSVTVPDGVTVIGDEAFSGCTALTTVSLPDSVTEIGDKAFYNCRLLTMDKLPSKLVTIGDAAFSDCRAVTFGSLPSTVTTVGASAFQYCSALTQMDMSGTAVTTLPNYLFSGCTKLASIDLPRNLTAIGDAALSSCSALTSIDLPDTVTSIGTSAFALNTNLETIELPAALTTLGVSTFRGCSKLVTVSIPDNVTVIPDQLFLDCTALVSVRIPNEVTAIGTYAFQNTAITEMHMPETLTTLGSYAFKGCSKLTAVTIPDGITTIDRNVFENCTSLKTVTIGEGTTSIMNDAFKGCTALTTINFPATLQTIGDYAFDGCAALTEVALPCCITKIGNYTFRGCTTLTSITLPSGLQNIGMYAFANCTSLAAVNFPAYISASTLCGFNNCTGLTEITIPEGVTDIYGFDGCTNLKTVTLPSTLTRIVSGAFSKCSSLESVVIPENVTIIEQNAFANCSKLANITVSDNIQTLNYNAFNGTAFYNDSRNWDGDVLYLGNWLLVADVNLTGNYTVRDGTVGIADESMSYCDSLTGVTLPDTVMYIGYQAFYNSQQLASIDMSDNVESIDLRAFGSTAYYNNTANWDGDVLYVGNWAIEAKSTVTDAYLRDGTVGIARDAFNFCRSLTAIRFPASLRYICRGAFEGCSALQTVSLPEGVRVLSGEVFKDCTALRTVTLPSTLTTLGFSMFSGCTSLAEITFPNRLTSIGYYTMYNTAYANNRANWQNGLLYVGNYLVAADNTLAGECTVKDGTLVIADGTFSSCSALTTLALPSSVSDIGTASSTFYNCSALRSIDVAEGNSRYRSINGVLVNAQSDIVHIPSQMQVLVTVNFTDTNGNAIAPSKTYSYKPQSIYQIALPEIVGYTPSATHLNGTVDFYAMTLTAVYYDQTVVAAGSVNDSISYILYEDGKLSLRGSGAIPDYILGTAPWAAYKETITAVVPDARITAIGAYAFADLPSLQRIDFSNGVKSIGAHAFDGCSALTSVSLPAGVTVIESGAFAHCDSLTLVVIPDGITAIESEAFFADRAIETVMIGTAVQTIGDNAFGDCTALTTVHMRGKPAVLGETVFGGNNVSVYYYPHIHEWGDVLVDGMWGGYLAIPANLVSEEAVSGNLFTVKTVDKHGTPLANATITLGDQSYTTADNGLAYFSRPDEAVLLRVVCEDHIPFENPAYSIPADRRVEIVELTDAPSNVTGVSCNGEAIATTPYKLNCNTDEDVTIVVNGYSKYDIVKYELLQGARLLATVETDETTATFTVKASVFEEGESVIVKMYVSDETVTASSLHIQPLHVADLSTETLFPNAMETSILFQFPPFGTYELPINLQLLNGQKIFTAVEGDTIRVGINFDFSKYHKDERKDLFKTQLQREIQNSLKSYKKDDSGPGSTLMGYLSIKYLGNDEYVVDSCYVKLASSIQLGFKAQASFYGIVGVYFKVALSGEGALELTVSDFNLEDGFVIDDLDFTLEDKLRLEGGVYLLWGAGRAGFYGQITMGFTVGIAPRVELEEVWLKGEYGITYSVLWGWIAGDIPFNKGNDVIYHWKNADTYSLRRRVYTQSVQEAMQDPDTYHFNDRSYLQDRSPWLSGISTFGLTPDDGPSYLQANTYYNIAPKTVTCGNTTVMVWLDDNEARDDSNYQTLYYAVYDKETDVWSEPMQLDTNDTFDCEFDLVTDGTRIYVLYTEQKAVQLDLTDLNLEDKAAIEALASGTEVGFAVFENGRFTVPTRLTDNNTCETLPTLVSDSTGVTAVWTQVNGMDLTSQVTDSTVITRTYNDGAWSDECVVTEKQPQISSVTAAVFDDTAVTVFVLDTDNNTFTESDKSLIAYTANGEAIELAAGMIANVTTASVNGKTMLVWSQDGILYGITSLDAEPVILSADGVSVNGVYEVVTVSETQTLLTYTTIDTADESGTDVFANFIDENGATSGAFRLTASEGYVDRFSASVIDGQLMLVFTESFAQVQDDSVETETNMLYDLYTFETDLAIDAVETDFDIDASKDTLDTAVTVTNNGAVDANGVTATVYDPSGNAVYTASVTTVIKAGETMTLDLALPFSATITNEAYTLEILPQTTDSDTADNRTDIFFGYSDLSVSTEQKLVGNHSYLVVTVHNSGNVTANGTVTVTVGENTPLATIAVDALETGAASVYYVDVSGVTKEEAVIICDVATDGNDPYELNNRSVTVLFLRDADSLTVNPDDVVKNPELSAATAVYDLYTDTNLTVTITAEADAFSGIDGLTADEHFTLDGDTLTIKAAYLQTLATATHTLTIRFGTVTRSLAVTVIDTAPIALSGEVAVHGDALVGNTVSADISGLLPFDAALTFEWSVNGTVVSTDAYYTITAADNNGTLTLTVRGTNGYSGELSVTVTVDKQTPSVPTAPVILGKTAFSLTVAPQKGMLYKLNDGEWQTSPVFEDLAPDTAYTVYQKAAETDTAHESAVSNGTVVTTAAVSLYGDLTNDHTLNSSDVRAALYKLTNAVAFTHEETYIADLNGDGAVDTADIRLMLADICH